MRGQAYDLDRVRRRRGMTLAIQEIMTPAIGALFIIIFAAVFIHRKPK
jgi:hypothetical protein